MYRYKNQDHGFWPSKMPSHEPKQIKTRKESNLVSKKENSISCSNNNKTTIILSSDWKRSKKEGRTLYILNFLHNTTNDRFIYFFRHSFEKTADVSFWIFDTYAPFKWGKFNKTIHTFFWQYFLHKYKNVKL